jgi:hypothetical protein
MQKFMNREPWGSSAWPHRKEGWSGVGEDGSGEVRSVFIPSLFFFSSFSIINKLINHCPSSTLKTAAT